MKNLDNIVKWCEALESGEYEQTKDCLHENGDGYCCLGVACELAILDGVAIRREVSDGPVDLSAVARPWS